MGQSMPRRRAAAARHGRTSRRDFRSAQFAAFAGAADALMLELAPAVELLVSQMRAVLSMLLLLPPLINAGRRQVEESMIGLLGAVFAIVMSQVWLALRGSAAATAGYCPGDCHTITSIHPGAGAAIWCPPVIGPNSIGGVCSPGQIYIALRQTTAA